MDEALPFLAAVVVAVGFFAVWVVGRNGFALAVSGVAALVALFFGNLMVTICETNCDDGERLVTWVGLAAVAAMVAVIAFGGKRDAP